MKTQKVSSSIPLKRVGAEIWKKVSARQKRNPKEGTTAALNAVAKAHPELYKRYKKAKKGPGIGRAAGDMDFLVDYLNSPSGAEMRKVLEPIINWQRTPLEAQKLVAERLASRLSEIDTRCYTHTTNGKRPYFYWSAFGHPFYQRIARGLQTGGFWKLRQCLVCKSFFVTEDHRRNTCPGNTCSKKRKNIRAAVGMRNFRDREHKLETNQLREFIEMCNQKPSIIKTMEKSVKWESTTEKIDSGIEKGWTAKKIVNSLSGKGRGWILRNKQGWLNATQSA